MNIIYGCNRFIHEADNKLTHYVGADNNRQIKKVVMGVALSALTISSNCESCSPLKYYQTTYFVESVVAPLETSEVAQHEDTPHLHDKLIYHALLYAISKTFLYATPLNDERLLSILATPEFVTFASKQPWFQELKKQCLKIGLKASLAEAVDYVKQQLKHYVKDHFINPFLQIIAEDKSVLLKNLVDSCHDFVAERYEVARDLAQDAEQVYTHLVTKGGVDLTQPHQIEAVFNRIKKTTQKIHHLTAAPKITVLKPHGHKPRSPIPFYLKAYTAWTLFADYQPALAPLLFTSPCTDAVDLATRITGVGVAYVTGHNFLSTVVAEIASQIIPNKFRRFPANVGLSELTHRVSSWSIGNLEAVKRSYKESALEDGVSLSMLKTFDKVIAQSFTGGIYLAASCSGHPLANALGACTFMEYLGIVADHYHLVELNSVASQTPYLDKVPFQMMIGFALTALEIGSSLPRPIASLACLLSTAPVVIDRVIGTNFYQNYILVPLKEVINPDYRAQRWANVAKKGAALAETVGLGSTLTTCTQVVAAATEAGIFTKAGYRFLKHPAVQNASAAAAIVTVCMGDIYMKSIFCSTVSFYFGAGIGAVANVIHKPKDLAALGAISAGVVVGVLTQSPFQVTATTEIVDRALRTRQGRDCCQRVTDIFYATTVPLARKVVGTLNTGVNFTKATFRFIRGVMPF